jgi:thioredoxin-like negative regulator of GroEL
LQKETLVVVRITDANFEKIVAESAIPFFLLFTSPWCATCKKLSPVLEMLSQSHPQIGFGRIDISSNLVVPSEYDVLSIPSLLVFREGKELARFSGQLDEEKLRKAAENFA